MASPRIDIAYPVLVTRRADGFELRIEELLLIVVAASLKEGWRELDQKKRQITELAAAAGLPFSAAR